jgi:CHAT domain-containing protein
MSGIIPAGILVFRKPAGDPALQGNRMWFAQNVRVCLLLFIAIPVVGSRARTIHLNNERPLSRSPDLQAIMTEANTHFQSGDYDAAAGMYTRGLELSRARGDAFNAACFLAGFGNYLVLTHQYSNAAEAYRQATAAALNAGHHDLAVRVAVNRATLYRRMGEKRAAVEAMHEVRDIVPSRPPAWLLIQAGNLASDEVGIERAAPYFTAAAEQAATDGDSSTQASALAQLGYLQLRTGHVADADRALTEAFRIRRMSGNLQTASLFFSLSMLRLAQGDHASALHLIDRALESPAKATAVAPAFLRYQRARVLAESGRFEEAAGEYETAIEYARDWRLRVVPADTFRMGADVSLQQIYSGYIDAEMALFRKTGNRDFERRSFELAEINRAASLRETTQEKSFPSSYWEGVANLRTAIAAEIAGDSTAGDRADRLRKRLIQHEYGSECVGCGFSHRIKERSSSEKSLSDLQHRLGAGEALLSFHTSERASYVWAMTRETFESHLLPGRKEIADAVAAFDRAFGQGTAEISRTGTVLRRHLLGQLSAKVASKPAWILSVDDPLHGVPFGAFPAADDGSGFLMESHSIRIIPGASMMRASALPPVVSTRFIGFADGIYNGADPRWATTAQPAATELPRLPGTRQEVLASAASWGGDNEIFTGADLGRVSVQRITSGTAAIVHFGTHVVADRSTRGSLVMALGLNSSGQPENLTPTEISGWRCPAGMIVLSGCHSGTGEALPGAGLIGLTRAWLLAGAQAVTATYWPITDDAGDFFTVFYKQLQQRAKNGISASSAAESLRAAQLEILRGGGRHARPEYWAAFFVVGKD